MRRVVLDPGVLVSGDKHLLDLAAEAPIHTPADFLAAVEAMLGAGESKA